MAKFHEVFADFEALFTNFIDQIDSLREVKINILGNNRLKEISKVVKANDLLKHLTDVDIIILINEEVFEKLEADQQMLVVEEAVAKIYFDAEKGSIKIIKPDIPSGFSLVMQKYGLQKYLETHLLIKEIFAQQGDAEADSAD